MIRNTLLCALAVGAALATSICCPRVCTGETTIVVSDGPDDGQNQIALQDTFDDNKTAWLWGEYSEDPNNVRVMEVNKRLELRTSAAASGAFAGYVGYTWRIDPRYDFAMRVEFHYDLYTLQQEGWIGIGLTPDAQNPRKQRVGIGVGCVNLFRSYSYERVNGYSALTGRDQRNVDNGTLYISYDSREDIVYLSPSGYGPEYAWAAYADLIRGTWGSQPVYVYLGGGSVNLAIGSGHAYLDNITVDLGQIIEASLKPVYRFWSRVNEAHFFTISEFEKNKLIDEYSDVWTYEGPAFRAFPSAADPNCRPVYRFWSDKTRSHLYTLDESEVNKLLNEYAFTWIYEGVAFYAYPEGMAPAWALPVYRFWSATAGAHFFTMKESEAQKLRNQPNLWFDEGIAWYAVP